MIDTYGWLYGVYVGLGGLALIVFGFVFRAFSRSALREMEDMNPFSFSPNPSYTIDGKSVSAAEFHAWLDGSKTWRGPSSAIRGSGPFDVLINFMFLLGVVGLLGGIVLAIVLRRRGVKQKH